jgi:hypothetical protein
MARSFNQSLGCHSVFQAYHRRHWDSESIARRNKQHFLTLTPSIGHCTLGIKKDLESIALFLAMKSLSATAIQAQINNVLGPGTVAYSTVTRFLRKRSFAGPSERPPHMPKLRVPTRLTKHFYRRSMKLLLHPSGSSPRGS